MVPIGPTATARVAAAIAESRRTGERVFVRALSAEDTRALQRALRKHDDVGGISFVGPLVYDAAGVPRPTWRVAIVGAR
jgi:hypothetical protein